MTEKELLYIKTIAEEKNITRAAGKLHIAQPSLTQLSQFTLVLPSPVEHDDGIGMLSVFGLIDFHKHLVAPMTPPFLSGIMASHIEDAFSAKMALVCHGNTF